MYLYERYISRSESSNSPLLSWKLFFLSVKKCFFLCFFFFVFFFFGFFFFFFFYFFPTFFFVSYFFWCLYFIATMLYSIAAGV